MKKFYLIFLAIFIAGFSCFSQSKTTVQQSSAIPLSMQASPQSNELLLKSAMVVSPQDLSNIKDVVYLRTGTYGNYWDQNGNATALDNTFGAGNWTRLNFEGLDVPALLATNVKFIFIDGSNWGTCEFISFLNSYRTELEAWVFSGGSLFLNAAPNECYSSPIELISNDTLTYQGSRIGTSTDNSHPIFIGPKTPVITTTYNGDSFSHTYVYGEGLVPILLNSASNPILAEKKFGCGTIMFGGLTLEFFGQYYLWSPEPQISNLYSNILQYMYDAAYMFCIDDITQDNDADECGAVVHYDYPTCWAAATVTQIDGTGLSSDSLFPVGVTTQSYQLVWDGGSGPAVIGEKSATVTGPLPPTDTCTFTVTVVDTTPPVVTCRDKTIYLDAEGNASLSLGKVLLLWDVNNSNTQSLKAAIEAEGFEVTLPSVPEYSWDNTNPSLDEFDAVIHLDGTTHSQSLPIAAQNALVDFVTAKGKTFIHSEWDAYEIDDKHWQDAMTDIIILKRTGGRFGNLTYTIIPGKESHQVLTDLPGSFTILNSGCSPSVLRSYSTDPAEALMTDQYGTPSVAVRSFTDAGKVVGFNFAGNYNNSDCLSNPNVQKLYTNALKWGIEKMTLPSSDNCGDSNATISKDLFTCEDLGDNTVTVTATDNAGNVSTCTSTVTVIDTIPPTIDIPSEITISLNSLGQADAVAVNFIKALNSLFVSDNCSAAEVTAVSGPATTRGFTRLDVNQLFDLSVEATDDNGNKTTAATTIKIVDDIAPVIKCNSIDILLREDGRYAFTLEDIAALTAGTTDNADDYEDITFETWPKAFGCEDVSDKFQIDVYATDKAGNKSKCWVYCRVIDPNALTIDPIADVEMDIAPGVCETAVTYPDIHSSSPCATLEQIEGLGPNGVFPLGTTVEKWRAYNTSGDTVEIAFNVTITTTNAVPTLGALADVTVDEDSPVVNVPLSGISYGIDCSTQAITVTAIGNNASLVTGITVNYTSPDATGSLDLIIAPDVSGTDTIEVTVADEAGGTISDIFVLTVNEVNDPPTLDQIANVTANEDDPVINVPLTGITGGPASEPQNVSISALGSNSALLSALVTNYTSPNNTGSIDLTLAPNMNGVDSIRVTVVDNEGLSHSRTFVLIVNPVNDAPTVVNKVDDYEVNASYDLTTELGQVFTDIDGDDLVVTVTKEDGSALPAWATVTGTNLFSTPMIADTGCVTLIITATDPAGATASDTFDICVKGYPTSIDVFDANALEISMYPNPSKGKVHIKLNSSNVYDIDLAVLDITGKLVLQKQYTAAEQIGFDMSKHVSGMYFVKMKIDNKQFMKKLILDRK